MKRKLVQFGLLCLGAMLGGLALRGGFSGPGPRRSPHQGSPVNEAVPHAGVPAAEEEAREADEPVDVESPRLPPLEVHGRVTDLADRQISGASIRVEKNPADLPQAPSGSRTIRSDAGGGFLLEISEGESILVAAPAFAPLRWSPPIPEDEGATRKYDVRFALRPVRTLEGLVEDEQGKPIGNASVEIQASPGDAGDGEPWIPPFEVLTGEGGAFNISTAPRCPLRVSAKRAGFTAESRLVLPGEPGQLHFSLARLARVEFQVLGDGEPFEGFMAIYLNEDASGHRSWPGGIISHEVPAGLQIVRISAEGYLAHDLRFLLEPGEVRKEKVDLDPGLTVRGRLFAGRDRPLREAGVILMAPEARHAETDDSGSFTWKGVPPGRHRVRAYLPGLGGLLEVEPGEVDAREGLEEVVLRIPESAAVAVTLLFVDGAGNEVPLGDGDVHVVGESEHLRRLVPGLTRHRFVLPAKAFWVFGSAEGPGVIHSYWDILTPVPGLADQEFVVRPLPDSTISGTVRDRAGAPIPGALVTFSWRPGACTEGRLEADPTGASGAFLFPSLRARSGRLICSLGTRCLAEKLIQLAPGENRADFRLQEEGAVGPVDLLVVDPGGNPLESVRVVGELDYLPHRPLRTGADGTVRIEAMGPGPQPLLLDLHGVLHRTRAQPGCPLTVTFPPVREVSGDAPLRAKLYLRRDEGDYDCLGPVMGPWKIGVPAGHYRLFALGDEFLSEVFFIDATSDVAGVVLKETPWGRVRGELPPQSRRQPGQWLPLHFRVLSGPYAGLREEGSSRMDSFLSPALPPGPVEIESGGRELGLRIHCVAEVVPGRTVDVSGSLRVEETATGGGD